MRMKEEAIPLTHLCPVDSSTTTLWMGLFSRQGIWLVLIFLGFVFVF